MNSSKSANRFPNEPVPGSSTSHKSHLKRIAHPEGSNINEEPVRKKSEHTAIKKPIPALQIYTGTIPQILHASKSNPGLNLLYETYGTIFSIKPGRFHCEKIILLRSVDGKGPVIQGFFYEIDLSLSADCQRGQLIRCMGRFTSESRFQIIKIGPTQQAFIDSVNRLNSFSNFSILRS